jgi:hypothetical protein
MSLRPNRADGATCAIGQEGRLRACSCRIAEMTVESSCSSDRGAESGSSHAEGGSLERVGAAPPSGSSVVPCTEAER